MTTTSEDTPSAGRSASRRILTLRRPELAGWQLQIVAAVMILAIGNATFWGLAQQIFAGQARLLALFAVAIFGLTLFTVALFGFRWFLKPVAAALLLLCGVTSYYTDVLGVVIDRDMIRNVMLTTVNESRHLFTPGLAFAILLKGVLPAALILLVRVRPTGLMRSAGSWLAMVTLGFALLLGGLFVDFKAMSAVLRERQDLMAVYQPGAPIAATAKFIRQTLRARNTVVAPLGRDATKGPRILAAAKPVVTVLFVGETLRAQNWGLNGYAKATAPRLAARDDVISYTDVTSCGTATAISVPCMFSNLTRGGYSYEAGVGQENLLDVLTHADVDVIWLDNNTGDQGNGKRLPIAPRTLTAADDPASCARGECTDAIFLTELGRRLPTVTRDTVFVLHMIGNHGPAYFMRYTDDFKRFTPACETAEFARCTPEQIVNAYDNAALFTDHVLAETIEMLNAQPGILPAMYFLSDHGESLGEKGLFLHGAPWFMAPDEQTRVPMTIWTSERYRAAMGLDLGCMQANAAAPASQDNLFHTMLGLMDITTTVRDTGLDLSSACAVTQG